MYTTYLRTSRKNQTVDEYVKKSNSLPKAIDVAERFIPRDPRLCEGPIRLGEEQVEEIEKSMGSTGIAVVYDDPDTEYMIFILWS